MSALQRLARRALRVPSAAGWALLAATAVLTAAAGPTGWVELRAGALAGAAVLVVAGLFTLGRSDYRVEVVVHADRVVVGERAIGELRITCAARHRLLPARIDLPVGDLTASFPLPSLAPGQVHEEGFLLPTDRRGVVVVGPVSSVRGDPLGLLRRTVRWTAPQSVRVHPRTVRLDLPATGRSPDLDGAASGSLTSSDIAFHALRQYVPGDDRRHVHWRTSARTGELVVRQYDESRRAHVVVVLSTAPADYASAAELELAISAAGSWALSAMRSEQRTTVLTTRGPLPTATPRALLDSLADLPALDDNALAHRSQKADDDAGGVAVLLRDAARRSGASGTVVLTGAHGALAQVQRGARALPVDVPVVVVRALGGEGARIPAQQPSALAGVSASGRLAVVGLTDLLALPRAARAASL
ncbi:DUF58 domain-containing protein [Quadrisphaera oryzae]|uniref:DUF58 domain-containing protein n=1 Tax=Quadrisphaera TaxID=317661 RepID=UPI001648235D|nr:DUF58 domain-containing protein [Quadrisphaera sp. RL12-1S]MBC3764163.1 DUF58 domain-containing protein [Quadrisphaera sp. RL12-1S]